MNTQNGNGSKTASAGNIGDIESGIYVNPGAMLWSPNSF